MKKLPDFGMNLEQFLGQANSKETQDAIKQMMIDAVNGHPGVESTKVSYCGTLWTKMTLSEKIKWFAYNRFPLRKRGELERRFLMILDERERLYWRLSNPGKDPSDYSIHFELPNHLVPNPKQIIVTDMLIQLAKPIEYITTDIEFDSDGNLKSK